MAQEKKSQPGQALSRLRDEVADGFENIARRLHSHEEPVPRIRTNGQMVSDEAERTILPAAFENLMPGNWMKRGDSSFDVDEQVDRIVVRSRVPNVDPKDISVEVTEDRLVIRGRSSTTHEDRKGGVYRSSASSSSFMRSLTLAAPVKREEVSAKMEGGRLVVTLPKTDEAKARHIEVSVAD